MSDRKVLEVAIGVAVAVFGLCTALLAILPSSDLSKGLIAVASVSVVVGLAPRIFPLLRTKEISDQVLLSAERDAKAHGVDISVLEHPTEEALEGLRQREEALARVTVKNKP